MRRGGGVRAGEPDLDSAGNVQVALREGDVHALFVKAFFHLSHEVPVDIPVVGGAHPGSCDQVDRAVGQFVHANHRCGVIECLGMGAEQFFEDVGGLGDLRAVGDAELQIHAAGVLPGDVGDDAVPDLIVGHEHELVVERQDGGGDEVHRFNLAEHPARIDDVTTSNGRLSRIRCRSQSCSACPGARGRSPGRWRRSWRAAARYSTPTAPAATTTPTRRVSFSTIPASTGPSSVDDLGIRRDA
jgi:hypothetical protein